MAGAAPSAKPAPFLRPLDIIDRGVLLAESALSLVIVAAIVFIPVIDSASRVIAGWMGSHGTWLLNATAGIRARSGDILLQGTLWAAFFGASFATRGRKHLAIDIVGRLLPDRGRRIVAGVAATLGAFIAYMLARGIYESLVKAAHEANEQLIALRQSGATSGEVDRSYEFQFIIPGGFLLISIRLLLHAFHEFLAAMNGVPSNAGQPPPAEPAEGLHENIPHAEQAASAEEAKETGTAAADVRAHDVKLDAPVASATVIEAGIAFAAMLAVLVVARGSTVMRSATVVVALAAATLAVPLILRFRRTKKWTPTAPDVRVEAKFDARFAIGSLAAVVAILFASRYGFAHVRSVPTTWGIVFFALMAVSGAPLFTFLGGTALFLWMHGSTDVAAQSLSNSVEDALGPHFARMSVLPTIPVFTLAGYLMSESKTPQRMVRVARAWLGWMPGGLAVVCLFASAFFTIFSGASGITIVAIGGLLFPALRRDKYPEKFSLGLVTTGGALGITFFPCLPLIVYGIVAGLQEAPPGQERLELSRFLLAGVYPGLLTIGILAVYAAIVGTIAKVPRSGFQAKEAFASLWEAKWEILLPVLLAVGLKKGWFNPSQAAAFTAFYVFVIEVWVYKDLSLTRDLPRIVPESMTLVGAIFVKLCAATVLTMYFVQAQTADKLFEWLTCGPPAQAYMHAHADTIGTCREAVDILAQRGVSAGGMIDSKISFLIALNVFLLIVGMLMDIFSAIVVVVPLISGIAMHFHINPYHLGIVFLLNLEIGYLMPPMGLNLFIASFRFNRPVPDLYTMVLPFIGLFVVALMLTTYVPSLTLSMVPPPEQPRGAAANASANPLPTTPTAGPTTGTNSAVRPCGDVPDESINESFEAYERRCPQGSATPAPAAPAGGGRPCGDVPDESINESFEAYQLRCPDGSATPAGYVPAADGGAAGGSASDAAAGGGATPAGTSSDAGGAEASAAATTTAANSDGGAGAPATAGDAGTPTSATPAPHNGGAAHATPPPSAAPPSAARPNARPAAAPATH